MFQLMTNIKQVSALIKKEFLIEWRTRYALNGILLYVISTIFLAYLSFVDLEPSVWNGVFWIIMLFAITNAVAKSFINESARRKMYYFFIVAPWQLLLSKIIYNLFLGLLIGFISFSAYALVLGLPAMITLNFSVALFLGVASFSILFTIISAIASQNQTNSAGLMAVLGFPIVIPMLLILIKLSNKLLTGDFLIDLWRDIAVLIALNVLVAVISFILFPFIWKD
jgi:heme exporter protein B